MARRCISATTTTTREWAFRKRTLTLPMTSRRLTSRRTTRLSTLTKWKGSTASPHLSLRRSRASTTSDWPTGSRLRWWIGFLRGKPEYNSTRARKWPTTARYGGLGRPTPRRMGGSLQSARLRSLRLSTWRLPARQTTLSPTCLLWRFSTASITHRAVCFTSAHVTPARHSLTTSLHL